MKIATKDYRLSKLLDEVSSFNIPAYQRALEWDDSNFISLIETIKEDINLVSDFYDDIKSIENPIAHTQENSSRFHVIQTFLGNIVMHGKDVVDGQQRLTSLMIILKAINDSYRKVGDVPKFEDKIFFMLDSIESYLKPTVSGMKTVMVTSEVAKNKDINKSFINGDKKLGNFKISRLYNKAMELFKKPDGETLEAYLTKLAMYTLKIYSIQIIKLEVQSIEAAFDIFETLNSKSTPLSPSDLIKNKIMQKMHNIDKKIDEKIEVLLEKIGDLDPTSFYRMSVMIYKAKEGVENPYVKKSSLYTDEFSKISDITLKKMFSHFEEMADIYKKYFIDKNIFHSMVNISHRFFDTKRVKVLSTLNLFLLYEFQNQDDKRNESALYKFVNWIENYFIGMFTLSNKPAKEVDKIVPILIKDMMKVGAFTDEAFEMMKTRLLGEFPISDRETMYEKLATKLFNNTHATHILNKLYDNYNFKDKKKYEHTTFDGVTNVINNYVSSLEHLLPQKPINWIKDDPTLPKPDDINKITSDDKISKLIYSIGNMFIIHGGTNSGLGNNPLSIKLEKLEKEENQKDMNLVKSMTILKDFDLFKNRRWGTAEIEGRAKDIKDIFEKNGILDV